MISVDGKFFVRRGGGGHKCPSCKCREPVRAVLFTGFNVEVIREFLGVERPLVRVVDDGSLVVHGWIGWLPPGTWLYREGSRGVERESAVNFYANFERPS